MIWTLPAKNVPVTEEKNRRKGKTEVRNRKRFPYEEFISKTSYIHSFMLLICSSGHSKEANFQH